LNVEIEKVSSLIKEVQKDSGAGDNAIGRPLAGYKAIPQGETLNHKFSLFQATEVELGLLLAGLNHFSLFPFVGAHYATGCGEIAGSWTAYEITQKGKIEIGTIEIGDYEPIKLSGKLPEILSLFENFMDTKSYDFKYQQTNNR